MRYSPLLLLPLAVSASPQVKKDLGSVAKNLFCVLNNDVITALKAQSTATSYCSSYLSIATKTLYVAILRHRRSLLTYNGKALPPPQ